MGNPRTWKVRPGETIILPVGSELMRSGLGHQIWYNPIINKSYYMMGNNVDGWQIIEYDQPFCDLCWERREAFLRDGV